MAENKYELAIARAACDHGIDRFLLTALIKQESNFDPEVRSSKGAVGLCQFMPATAREMGLRVDDEVDERLDPKKSIDAAAAYLAKIKKWVSGMVGQYETRLMLASYNGGFGNVKKFGDVPPFSETQKYVARITEEALSMELVGDDG